MKHLKNMQIVALGHAFVLGARGEAGGAPSKDSIWGLAIINNALVSFSGRRNAARYKFKTYKLNELEEVLAFAKKKFTASDNKRTEYVDILDMDITYALRDNFEEFVYSNYYLAIREGKLNNTNTRKK